MTENRKEFNFESVILEEMTQQLEGYSAQKFGKTSNKFIWASCRHCGKPHRIRKGFFNKAGYACHKMCKIEEQKKCSPFKDPLVRAKSKKTNLEKYGSEFASQNKEIAKKISEAKRTEESLEKVKTTTMERYGVDNVFQNEEIKQKIRETNIEKYGVDHHMKNKEVQEKTKQTCIDRYGVDNLQHNNQIKKKSKQSFDDAIKNDISGNYVLINTLRGEAFWKEFENKSATLSEICEKFSLSYQSVASTLSRQEFKDRFHKIYSFPKIQTQFEMAEKIKSLGFTVILNDRSVIAPSELDIYIPDKNLAIEYNGSYWHSEAILSPSDAYKKHINKLRICDNKNIRLLNIFEKTWQTREKQIMNFIKSILGVNAINIDARKCQIIEDLPKISIKNFIDDNHIQGYGKRTIKSFSLLMDNKIVASMTASKHHRQNSSNDNIVLNRLCFLDNHNVRGGSSRLFSAMVLWAKTNGYKKIISWSDNCLTPGGIYKTLGFVETKKYKQDYFYWDMKNNTYVSKQSQRKSNTQCPEGLTEREWCYQRKLYRIWDCGKKTWEFSLK